MATFSLVILKLMVCGMIGLGLRKLQIFLGQMKTQRGSLAEFYLEITELFWAVVALAMFGLLPVSLIAGCYLALSY